MPAYLVVNIDVTDPTRYQEYIRAVPHTIEQYGGKYLARSTLRRPCVNQEPGISRRRLCRDRPWDRSQHYNPRNR